MHILFCMVWCPGNLFHFQDADCPHARWEGMELERCSYSVSSRLSSCGTPSPWSFYNWRGRERRRCIWKDSLTSSHLATYGTLPTPSQVKFHINLFVFVIWFCLIADQHISHRIVVDSRPSWLSADVKLVPSRCMIISRLNTPLQARMDIIKKQGIKLIDLALLLDKFLYANYPSVCQTLGTGSAGCVGG
jgi:hypothetical protein